MQESLQLFSSVANHTLLTHTKLILCFTKMDVFARDLATGLYPISKYDHYKDYVGPPDDVAAVKDYFTAKFTSLLVTPRELDIYYIDATDTEQVRPVVENILDGGQTSPPHATFTKHDTAHELVSLNRQDNMDRLGLSHYVV